MAVSESAVGRRALVLGGGGGFGLAQAAYALVAYELGFRPDIIVGTSVGALNGAYLAIHGDAEGLADVWRGLARRKILTLNPLRLAVHVARRRGGLCSNQPLPQLIADHIGERRFEDLHLPLAIVATNLRDGSKHVFNQGSLDEAVRASCAIPGVFEPVEVEGEVYVDGCLAASVDLATAIDLGATEILAIDLTAPLPPGTPRTPYGVLRRALVILGHSNTGAMESIANHCAAVRVVRPDVSALSPWRIGACEGAIDRSIAEARLTLQHALDSGHVVAGDALDGVAPARALPPRRSKPLRLHGSRRLRPEPLSLE
jgi:NTE family protein